MAIDRISCGACCAYSDSWPVFIGDGDGAGIPDELIDFGRRRMLRHGSRCAALAGEIGRRAHCSVYRNRPLVCREFQPGSDHGSTQARSAGGVATAYGGRVCSQR